MDDFILLILFLMVWRRHRRRRRHRSVWVRSIFRRRASQGDYQNLLQELRLCDPSSHFRYLRMSATTFRAGGSKMEVARPAVKMLPYKLFMRRSFFPALFFAFFAFAEYSNFCINCKCNRPQLQAGRRCHTVAPRRAQICTDAADVHKPIPFLF